MATTESAASPQLVEYPASCHCGAFKFIVKIPEVKRVDACDCSICSRKGYLWAFPASNDDVVVVHGDEEKALKEYTFGTRSMVHKFCSTCGIPVLSRKYNKEGTVQSVAVNVRALENIDFDSLEVHTRTFSDVGTPYQPPEPLVLENINPGMQVYQGNCHCGAISYAFQTEAPISKVTDCNCSICSKKGLLWTYPLEKNITFRGLESLVEYAFGPKTVFHGFCGTCGVTIRARFHYITPTTDPTKEYDMAISVRALNPGLDLGSVEIKKFNGKDMPFFEV
ncbi:Mss4-like protein [Mycena rebaudengoi]|nr:Mss4-like protein [Mycena rebaudengoi]